MSEYVEKIRKFNWTLIIGGERYCLDDVLADSRGCKLMKTLEASYGEWVTRDNLMDNMVKLCICTLGTNKYV